MAIFLMLKMEYKTVLVYHILFKIE